MSAKIQTAVAGLTKNKIFITTAHRLNTVRYIDQVLAVAGSKIIQRGNYDELTEQKVIYRPFGILKILKDARNVKKATAEMLLHDYTGCEHYLFTEIVLDEVLLSVWEPDEAAAGKKLYSFDLLPMK